MTAPTFAELVDPTQGGPGFSPQSFSQRLALIMAMIASGQNPDGTPGSRFLQYASGIIPDGVSDNWGTLTQQMGNAAAGGAGVFIIPPFNGPIGVSQDLIIPAQLALVMGGLLFSTSSTKNNYLPVGQWQGTTILPIPGATITTATVVGSQSSAIINGTIGGVSIGNSPTTAPMSFYANGTGEIVARMLILGAGGNAFVLGSGAKASIVDVCRVNNYTQFQNPAVVTPTFTSGANSNVITVSSGTGVTIGADIHNVSTPSSVTSGTYVTAVNGNVLTLNRNIGPANSGDLLYILANSCGGCYAPDMNLIGLETFHGSWVIGAGDCKHVNGHHSDAGASNMFNLVTDMGSSGSSTHSAATIDAATQVAGHHLRIRGSARFETPRIQVGLNSGTPWPFNTDPCCDGTGGSTVIWNPTSPNLTSVGLTQVFLYTNTINGQSNGKVAAANPLDRCTDGEFDSGCFAANYALSTSPQFNGRGGGNRYAGVEQVDNGAAVTNVRVATAAALPANTYSSTGFGTLTGNSNGIITVDGVTIAVGDIIVVNNEVTTANNGLYTCTQNHAGLPYILTRCAIMSQVAVMTNSLRVFALQGTANAGKSYTLAATGQTIGTTAIAFTNP